MHASTARAAIAAFTVSALTAGANAQFITAITKPTFSQGPTDVYNINPATGDAELIFNPESAAIPATAPGFNGLAADEPGKRLFASTRNGPQDDLYTLDYATLTPTLIGTITFAGDGLSLDGLAYDSTRGVLYGTRVLGSTAEPEGLYAIDTATGVASLVFQYEAGTSDFQIGGIDYDPLTDRIYLADDDATGGRFIYSLDPADLNAGLSPVVAYPDDVTDIDGVGAGAGRLYLLSDAMDNPATTSLEGNDGLHRVFNLQTGLFETPLPTVYPQYTSTTPAFPNGINPSGAAAFAPGIPTPSALPVAALAALVGARRRR